MGMRLYGIPYEIDVAFGFVLLSYVLTYIWLDIMKIKEIGFRAYLLGRNLILFLTAFLKIFLMCVQVLMLPIMILAKM
jgi:hypothetical protein